MNHRRFVAFLCLLLLSASNGVLGNVRGSLSDTEQSTISEVSTYDVGQQSHRILKRHHMRNRNMHHKEETTLTESTNHPTESLPPHTEYPVEYVEEDSGKSKRGKHRKMKSGKSKSRNTSKSSKKSGKYSVKGGKKEDSEKGVNSSSGKTKSGKSSKKSEGGRSKGTSGGHMPGDGPVEKKAKSSKEYGKSKYKLKKSSSKSKKSSYEYSETSYSADSTEESTYHPTTSENEPTLVEVPVSFYFAFGEQVAKRRRLDGHGSYEPTQEEVATLEGAIQEFSIGLFHYLHEAKPGTFHSVTPKIDRVVIKKNSDYPLQVDVTFQILYNEAPEDVPDITEIASILETAFTSEEFQYYYLWGREDIWNSVTRVKVDPNSPGEGTTDQPIGSNVPVAATILYDFSTDPTSGPSEEDYATLDTLTLNFFKDILMDMYMDDPDTVFEDITMTREAATFDLTSTPPVVVDYSFSVKFDDNSLIIPSSEDVFSIMAAGDQTDMFESYIRVYLAPSESAIWNTVNRVSLVELMVPAPPPADDPLSEISAGPPLGVRVISSMLYSFFEGMASRPGKEDYETLQMATNFFFMETLTDNFKGKPDAGFVTVTTNIDSSFYSGDLPEPLQVDYDTVVTFAGGTTATTSDEIFAILQSADYDSYIRNYLWPEGAPWNNVNGVMYVERIAPPEAS